MLILQVPSVFHVSSWRPNTFPSIFVPFLETEMVHPRLRSLESANFPAVAVPRQNVAAEDQRRLELRT